MPSASPVSSQRPKIQSRSNSSAVLPTSTSSAATVHFLSNRLQTSGAPAASGQQHGSNVKPSRPHLVSRHSRNVSYGHGHGRTAHANHNARAAHTNMPTKQAMAQALSEGRHHRRAKSGTTTPSASPRASNAAHMKRNSSHVVLPKNRSHGNLNIRKNQSTNTLTALNRNLSRRALNKLGAPADQKAKEAAQQKQGVFNLGDASDEDEEEGEWEDSTASPELTRNNTRNNSASNSKAHTPSRPQTPIEDPAQDSPVPDQATLVPLQKTSSPPDPEPIKNNRSAPNLRANLDRVHSDPTWLTNDGRSSRAPPAMTTAVARPSQQHLPRNPSQRSLNASSRASLEVSDGQDKSPTTSRSETTLTAVDSPSSSVPVSHFLNNEASREDQPRRERERERQRELSDDDDQDSVSDFLATYKPQVSESPEKPRTVLNRARLPNQPSRTQQKLELQRNQQMRGSAPPSSSTNGLALSVGSSVSVHSRSASKGRNRHFNGGDKAVRAEYENAIKQLTVVRRFRNPVIESLNRHQQSQQSAGENGAQSPNKRDQRRPPSRRGQPTPTTASKTRPTNNPEHTPAATPPENHKSVSFGTTDQRHTQPRDSRVTFQLSRQASHDEILRPVQTHADTLPTDAHDEEALIRRMWDSRIHVA